MHWIKIIDRYLIKEFIKPFILTLAALIVIMLSGYLFQLTDFIIIKDIPVIVVIKLLLYKIPQVMVQSLAMAVLFATLLSFKRLVKDKELTALRIGQIKVIRLVMPLLMVALIISGFNYLLNERLVPWSEDNYQKLMKYKIYKNQEPGVYEDIFFKTSNNRYLYISRVDATENKLSKVLIYKESQEQSSLITASQGNFKNNRLYLGVGVTNKLDATGKVVDKDYFEQLKLKLAKDLNYFYNQKENPAVMTRSELRDRIRLFKASGLDITKLVVEYHARLAKSLICLIFVLLGVSLSINSEEGRSRAFIIGIIVIFSYYVSTSIFQSLGSSGHVRPVIAVWLPNLIFSLSGGYLILKEDYLI